MTPKRIALCLYGRFNNRLSEDSGDQGFDYIKENILNDNLVDIFIFSSDLDNKNRIESIYSDWIRQSHFEENPDFTELLTQQGIDSKTFETKQGFRSLENSLSFFNSRSKSIGMMSSWSREHGVSYDIAITSRFDLGQIDKHNGNHSHKVSEIGFNKNLDMSFIYSAQWLQHNAGYADQWFFSNQENIELLGEMFPKVLEYFKPESSYQSWLSSGVRDSNASQHFSNERFNPIEEAEPKRYESAKAVDNHLIHKFFMIESGLYKISKFTSDFHGLANFVYSHSDYGDILPAFFSQQDKYLGPLSKNYLAIDKQFDKVPSYFQQLHYNDTDCYTKRLLKVLGEIDEEFILFQHEDMFLYDVPRVSDILFAMDFIRKSNKYGYAKLIRGGRQLLFPILRNRSFSKMSIFSPWQFSIQPTIWRKSTLEQLLRSSKAKSIWEFEVEAQGLVKKLKIKGLTENSRTAKRGKLHWDSRVYPFVATAIVKGKWNFQEYSEELSPILSNLQIDPLIRGLI